MSHPNARLTVHGRLLPVMRVESGWPVSAAAATVEVSRQTAATRARFRHLGEDGLADASFVHTASRRVSGSDRRDALISGTRLHWSH